MSLVDSKYQQNLNAINLAQIQINWLQQELDSLSYNDSERRDTIRDSISLLKKETNARLLEINSKEWGQQVSIRGGDAIGQIAYGEVRTGGQITFMSADEGTSGLYLHTLVTFTCHEIEGFKTLYVDGRALTFASSIYPDNTGWSTGYFPNLIFVSCRNLGSTSQTANSDLVGQSAALFPGKFTSSHRQRGFAGVYFLMMYDAEKFPNGMPELTAKFKGKCDIYDPRDSSTGYSNNAALCLANYLLDSNIGPGYSLTDLDLDSLSTAANVCDETVTIKSGTEKRYTCNGVFSASKGNNHQKIIEDLSLAMGGYICNSGGKWRFYAGKYRAPVVSLNESNLRSPLKISAKPTKSDIFNAVRGRYRGSLTQWEWGDYPPVKNSLYQSQDGERIYSDLDLSFVSSSSQAQRIAKIKLEESRQWIEVTASFDMSMYEAICGETVALSIDRLGWAAKEFYITDYQFNPGDGNEIGMTIDVSLRETAAGIWDWNHGEETVIDLAVNTTLPGPGQLPAPQNLALASGTAQLDIRSDGTVFSRIYVSWDATTNPFILTDGKWNVQYKKSGESDWRTSGFVDGTITKAWILDVADGELYDVRVRAETTFKGEWAYVYGFQALGKQEKPTAPSSLIATTSAKGISLSWTGITDLDLAGYEIRSGATFVDGEYIDITRSTSYLIGTRAAGSYNFTVAAKDTSRLYSDAIAVSVTIAAPSAVGGLAGLVVYNMIQMSWTAPTTSSFPVKSYIIRKGTTFETAIELGSVTATLKTIQEFTSGYYTYWVSAVDEYGNEGTASSITLRVDAPPLFQLLDDQILDFSAYTTLTNLIVENSELVGPINAGETFADHFTDHSWSTPQDQIDAGYPIYAQPIEVGNGIYEGVVDYGETISTVLVSVTYSSEWVDGDGDITTTISYSLNGTDYTAGTEGATQIIATNFRYVKVKFEIDGDDDKSIMRLGQARVRLEIKKTSDSGVVAAVSTDATGTVITYNENFLDVFEGTIKLLPQSNSAAFASYTIVGNVVSVFLWNTSGSRISGNVSWSIEGIIGETT